ncbi:MULTISPECIES: BldC family transcriptional regulator [Cellulosimicrobium]|uniref:BldC family transcriptional regulator n=1 Tax=Cellulosimicrobium sp. ES-005 TaxID=3163031 RepID=A0AAU8FWJ2_9MICO|nr:BldC family transcriptional regulator [Cellulosimicrobium cellulans]MCO7275085.1 BldC family transcriptional regulator [Cellulosimicrobium cellulans]
MIARRRAAAGRDEGERPSLLTPAEVAALFRVDPKTVTRWAQAGKITSVRTLGGHRRFDADEIERLIESARTGRTSETPS